MKRIISSLLVAVALLSLFSGCGGGGKPDNLSDDVYELGCAALETTDDYIDGKITASDALKKLDWSATLIDTQVEKELADSPTGTLYGTPYSNDNGVSIYLLSIKLAIGDKDRGTGTMSVVKDARNKLAKTLGK